MQGQRLIDAYRTGPCPLSKAWPAWGDIFLSLPWRIPGLTASALALALHPMHLSSKVWPKHNESRIRPILPFARSLLASHPIQERPVCESRPFLTNTASQSDIAPNIEFLRLLTSVLVDSCLPLPTHSSYTLAQLYTRYIIFSLTVPLESLRTPAELPLSYSSASLTNQAMDF